MSGLVNKETDQSVTAYLDSIESQSKKEDSKLLVNLMQEITDTPPKIWGNKQVHNGFIAFGKYTDKRKNGKEEFEWFHVGFAPRKSKITVYLTLDLTAQEALLKKLGKCTWGKGCLYINKLADIDLNLLKELISLSKESKWH